MRILFGPEHDGLHVDPSAPGAYEWWYFDALSDDGKYALVVIFFLGSPMSPYYKAVVDGKNPDPRDWCGVFVTLHENMGEQWREQWRERTYAYNLYRSGEFTEDGSRVAVGGSLMALSRLAESGPLSARWDRAGISYHLTLHEPGLWFSHTDAELTFTPTGPPLIHESIESEDDAHTWVCVAPSCRVQGEINGIRFTGNGYHDHNFGMLPYHNIDIWYWNRCEMKTKKEHIRTAVSYHFESGGQVTQAFVLIGDGKQWEIRHSPNVTTNPEGIFQHKHAYGFRQSVVNDYYWLLSEEFRKRLYCRTKETEHTPFVGTFSSGPFYRRYPILMAEFKVPVEPDYHTEEYSVQIEHEGKMVELKGQAASDGTKVEAVGDGIGEAFRPARLCGPLASRAMWTRMRRRS